MKFEKMFFEMVGAFKYLAFEIGACGAYAPEELDGSIVNEELFNDYTRQTTLLVRKLCGNFSKPLELRSDNEFVELLGWVDEFLANLKARLQHWWDSNCPLISPMVDLTRSAIEKLEAFEKFVGLRSDELQIA